VRRLSLAAPQTRHCEFGTGGEHECRRDDACRIQESLETIADLGAADPNDAMLELRACLRAQLERSREGRTGASSHDDVMQTSGPRGALCHLAAASCV